MILDWDAYFTIIESLAENSLTKELTALEQRTLALVPL